MNMNKTLVLVALVFCFSAFAAEPYDKKLEFIESTGTQWIDTGLKLHYRNSRAEVNFRVLEVPSKDKVSICGLTAKKGDACGYTSGSNPRASFAIRIQRASATTYRVQPSFTGGEGGGYEWPNAATSDFSWTWEIFNSWEVHTNKGSNNGTNITANVNGQLTGGYYRNVKDEVSEFTYYIGVANNAGEGLFDEEGSLAKLHWYGVKFWTDDVLVGNFIPVLKDGVAGFYDTVGEKFFPSQGADPWVAPTECEWIGEGDVADLADLANWKGGKVPSSMSDVAVIPADTTIAATINDACAFFTTVGAIRLTGEDSILNFEGITSSTSFTPAVGGNGRVRFTGAASDKIGLKLRGSLQNFRGITEISNVYTHAMCTYCLGDAAQSEAFVWLGGGEQRYCWGADQVCSLNRSKVHYRSSGQFLFWSGSTRDFGEAIFDLKDIGFHGNGSSSGRFFGKFIGNADVGNTINPYSASECTLTGEEKSLNLSKLLLQANKNIIACRVHSMPRKHNGLLWNGHIDGVPGCGQNMANITVGAGYPLYFQYENALDGDAFLQVGYAQGVAAQKANLIDLGGLNQQVGTLSVWASTFDETAMWNTNLVLTSDKPAKLTIYGQLRDDGAMHVFPGRVRGAAGVRLDSKDEVMADAWNWTAGKPGAIKFNCPGSDTTGALEVNRGTMDILSTATFSNLSSVVVSGTGVMNIRTSDVGNDNENFTVAIKDETATLDLAEGVSNVCYSCEIPNGRFLRPGVYSGTEQEGAILCEYLSGTGKLEVRIDGTPWTGWPEAGTTNAVYILHDTAVTIEDSDVEKVQALEKVECGTGVTIDCHLVNLTEIDFRPQFIGDVKIRVWGKDVGDVVTISGDNSGLVAPGGWFFSNCTAKVCHRYGLGTAATAPAEIYSIYDTSYSALEFNGDDVTQNDVALKFVNAGWLYHADPEVDFQQNADITVSGLDTGSSRRFKFKNKLTVTAGHTADINTFQMYQPAGSGGTCFTVAEGATLKCTGNFGTGSFLFYGTYLGEMRIEQCMEKIILGRDDAIQSSYSMMYDGSQAQFEFDLNGHNLALRDICGNQYPLATWANQQVIPIVSETAATLSLTGNVASAGSTRCAIRFTGAASCRIASGASQNNVFGKGVSRTTGSLIMDSGLLKLEREFRWLGAQVVLNGGELTVDATTAPDVFGHESGTDRTKVMLVPNGGTLKLASASAADKTYVYCVKTGDETYLPAGDYVAGSGSPAWLTGTGTLSVLHDCPPPSGLIFICY